MGQFANGATYSVLRNSLERATGGTLFFLMRGPKGFQTILYFVAGSTIIGVDGRDGARCDT